MSGQRALRYVLMGECRKYVGTLRYVLDEECRNYIGTACSKICINGIMLEVYQLSNVIKRSVLPLVAIFQNF